MNSWKKFCFLTDISPASLMRLISLNILNQRFVHESEFKKISFVSQNDTYKLQN